MNCRDVRELADSYLCDELLTETNHQILQHLETCSSCRAELDAHRRLRGALRTAFTQAPDLQASEEFTGRLASRLRDVSVHQSRATTFSRRWLAIAAGLLLTTGIGGAVFLSRSTAPLDLLVRDAIGDHRYCALKFRLARKPVTLEDAAQRFDSAYRLLLDAPPDDVSTPSGPIRVVDRHSCIYDGRRFGHVVMKYHGRTVSLLMTADNGAAGSRTAAAIPHVIGHRVDGLSVVSMNGSHHAIMLVSDLSGAELTQLSQSVSLPLAQRLAGRLLDSDVGALAALAP